MPKLYVCSDYNKPITAAQLFERYEFTPRERQLITNLEVGECFETGDIDDPSDYLRITRLQDGETTKEGHSDGIVGSAEKGSEDEEDWEDWDPGYH